MHKKFYMLDTNIASYVIKNKEPAIKEKLLQTPMDSIFISSITEAELLHGVAKNPNSKSLSLSVKEFLLRVQTLPWDLAAAQAYADLRVNCQKTGKSLSAMDMLIAAHSISSCKILVTRDKAFYNLIDFLKLEDWTR